MTKDGNYEEHPDIGGDGRGDHQHRRRGSRTTDLSQFRSQSRLRPATSRLWPRLRSRLWPWLRPATRSLLSQRTYRTRILPPWPVPELERMPAGLDRAGWFLQTLSGLLGQRITRDVVTPGIRRARKRFPSRSASRRIHAGLRDRLAAR